MSEASSSSMDIPITDIPIIVGGYLAVPMLSNFALFPPDTSLKEASNKIFEPININYLETFGNQPNLDPKWQHTLYKIDNCEGRKLQDLVPMGNNPAPTIEVVRLLIDSKPSFLKDMAEAAAARRAAVLENLLLMEQVEELQVGSKTGKKKKNTTAVPEDRIQNSPGIISELVSQLAAMNKKYVDLENRLESGEEKLVREVETLKNRLESGEEKWVRVDQENVDLRSEVQTLKKENAGLWSEVQSVKAMHDIYRRIVLDQARIKLLAQTGLTRNDLDSSALLAAVKSKLPNPFSLNDVALEMIFKNGPLRQRGNAAAHEGPPNAIGHAVQGSDLTNSDRENLVQIYEYVYGYPPMLGCSPS